ncbi:ATP-dependent helicase HrpB [Turneriella parva]|uniref:ATP-dependent helicase HrpB n=1 Tax=Turneriella parva (strain ATCC BAA-1111 / DSM 21527 / NCTC 11395 / H) TaxID=869212 RepID=I4B3E3_TURPD|nr:ATP-dependent helicase HrpB [Turneriella parva]AFM11800.1 ATP-dependent helicase HrpB [Turneriella parva DSM 21527]
MAALPVASALPGLKAALNSSPAAILTADTGSGKTTWLPLQLLHEPWLTGKKIIMLEPRRVAARAAASRLAHHLGEKTGKTVGYSVRFDSQVSAATRLEVVTEGILARRIVNDPELEGVGLVIFDEFHERHVETDLALALTLESQKVFRDDLRILVMSATIDTTAIAGFLGKAFGSEENPTHIPIVASAGTNYPVEVKYHNEQLDSGNRAMAHACARKAIEVHAKHEGDFLLFLPGTAEIFAATEFIEDRSLKNTVVLPLYGELTAQEQDRVLEPPKPNERRIIVATPIAESSLTLEGLTVVIDSGLVRQPALDPGTGLSYLETVPITQDSAVQRAGRAGRLGPGTCYRMYTEADFRRRPKTRAPEILRTDLAEASLRTLAFGSPLKSLMLPDMPSTAMLAQAERLLSDLGLIDRAGKLTTLGKSASALPLHPRLATMLAASPSEDTALLAAMLSERDAMRVTGAMATDLEIRFQSLQRFIETGEVPAGADRRGLEAIARVFKQLRHSGPWGQSVANALLFAYPDRVAMRRDQGSFLMRNGRGVYTEKGDWLAESEFIVAVDVSGAEKNAKLRLGLSVSREQVMEHFAAAIEKRNEIREVAGKPRAYEQACLGAIVLVEKETALPEGFAEKLVLQKLREGDFWGFLGDESRSLIARIELMRSFGADLPESSPELLQGTLDLWLAPFIAGARTLADVSDNKIAEALLARLSYQQQKLLEDNLPARLVVPSGSAHRIRYEDGKAIVAVRIQEVFGLATQPMLAGGKLAVTFELLSPGRQPIAVTKNLPELWKSTYADIRKEMRGQYPKHFWPEDPLSMQGTTGTKKAFDRKNSL